jgi:sporulation protein YlmC with PRC-barrel domain
MINMRIKALLGKNVVDAVGDKLGKVEDIEVDWETKQVLAIIIGGDMEIKQRFMEGKYAKSILGRLGAKADPDIVVDVKDISAVGDMITLSVDIK